MDNNNYNNNPYTNNSVNNNNSNPYTNSSVSNNTNKTNEYYYTAGSSNNTTNGGYYNTYQYQTQTQTQTQKPKKEKKQKGFGRKVVSFVTLGAVFGLAAGVAFSVPTYISNQELEATRAQYEKEVAQATQDAIGTTSTLTTSTDTTSTGTTSVAAIVENCLPSVVAITNVSVTEIQTMFGTYQADNTSTGSGIIIGKNDTELLIVTNYHVVSDSNELTVVFSYDEASEEPTAVSAKIKGYDSSIDVAVISVSLDQLSSDMLSQIKIATIGDSSALTLGEEVVAIGNALGYGQSVTTGIVSALDREFTVSETNGTSVTNTYIQTDAAINPGNSGGALLNMKGELVGINSAKVADSSVEGMGYAIPISQVQSIIEELMLKETRDVVDSSEQGYLGISGTDVTSQIASTYGMPVGVYVTALYEGSCAEAAGITKGSIITKFDGQSVSSMSDLQGLMAYYKSGETVEVVAYVPSTDGYVEQTFTLTLSEQSVFGTDNGNTQTTP